MAFNDLTGQRFARWLVKGLDETSTKPRYWFCVCDCGTKRRVIGRYLENGRSRSCGCLANQETIERFTTHGMHKHPAYSSWRKFRDRCHLPTATGYAEYGGRGIRFCQAWDTFEGFWKDMGSTWERGLSLDRIDVNGHYEPRNCRWATWLQQGNNRRNNQVIPTPYGPMTVSDAARQFGVNRNTIFRRIRDGWPRERLIEPAQFHPRWHNQQETT